MTRALTLAARALGTSSPNPAVGAVLVKGGHIVGEGFTQPPGRAHAEIVALEQAGSSARGATLYVTLEPCPHHGRTPPCVDAIVAAQVAEVQVALLDPSPWVNGSGRAALERAGIRTRVGLLEDEARRLNEGYLTWVAERRPFVTALYAIGLAGGIAEAPATVLGGVALAELERMRERADRAVAGLGALLDGDPTLAQLAAAGVTSLLVECGPNDLARLLSAGLADKLVAFVLPRAAGLSGPVSGQDGRGPDRRPTCERPTWERPTFERLGDDLMAVEYTRPCSPAS